MGVGGELEEAGAQRFPVDLCFPIGFYRFGQCLKESISSISLRKVIDLVSASNSNNAKLHCIAAFTYPW